MAIPQWNGHSDYIIAEEDLPDFYDLTTIDHPHFSFIILISVAKDIEKAKKAELVWLNEQPIKGSLYELLAKAKIPRLQRLKMLHAFQLVITIVDEEWFERRHKPKKGCQDWKL
jgi:hypothetical protein